MYLRAPTCSIIIFVGIYNIADFNVTHSIQNCNILIIAGIKMGANRIMNLAMSE